MKTKNVLLSVLMVWLCAGLSLKAQEANAVTTGEEQAAASNTTGAVATQRIYRPLSSNEKLVYAIRHSVASPLAYAKSAAGAGYSMAIDGEADRPYGMGAEGFGRRWADRMGKTTVSQLSGSWIAASLLHQDPRYHRSPNRAFGARIAHAFSRVVITRADDGSNQFNTHNLIGIVAGESVSLAWRPEPARGDAAQYFQRIGQSLAWNGVGKLFVEFFGRD